MVSRKCSFGESTHERVEVCTTVKVWRALGNGGPGTAHGHTNVTSRSGNRNSWFKRHTDDFEQTQYQRCVHKERCI